MVYNQFISTQTSIETLPRLAFSLLIQGKI